MITVWIESSRATYAEMVRYIPDGYTGEVRFSWLDLPSITGDPYSIFRRKTRFFMIRGRDWARPDRLLIYSRNRDGAFPRIRQLDDPAHIRLELTKVRPDLIMESLL